MDIYVFTFSLSKIKIQEIFIFLVDGEYVEEIEGKLRTYSLIKENE